MVSCQSTEAILCGAGSGRGCEGGSVAPPQEGESKVVLAVARLAEMPSEYFMVPSDESVIGRLNNSAYLNDLEAQLSYMSGPQ